MNLAIFYYIFALAKAQATMQCFQCDVTTNVMCDDPGEVDCQNPDDQVCRLVRKFWNFVDEIFSAGHWETQQLTKSFCLDAFKGQLV